MDQFSGGSRWNQKAEDLHLGPQNLSRGRIFRRRKNSIAVACPSVSGCLRVSVRRALQAAMAAPAKVLRAKSDEGEFGLGWFTIVKQFLYFEANRFCISYFWNCQHLTNVYSTFELTKQVLRADGCGVSWNLKPWRIHYSSYCCFDFEFPFALLQAPLWATQKVVAKSNFCNPNEVRSIRLSRFTIPFTTFISISHRTFK